MDAAILYAIAMRLRDALKDQACPLKCDGGTGSCFRCAIKADALKSAEKVLG